MSTARPRRFKLGFRNKSVEERVVIARGVIKSLHKVPVSNRPFVRLETLDDRLGTAERDMAMVAKLRSQLKHALSKRDESVAALCLAVKAEAKGYAGGVNFNGTQLVAGGLKLAAPWRRIKAAGAPTQLRAARLAGPGAVKLMWKRPVRRCVFVIEMTTAPNAKGGWKMLQNCCPAKCVIKNLEPGRLYWFRVCAVSSSGHSPWSRPVAVRPG